VIRRRQCPDRDRHHLHLRARTILMNPGAHLPSAAYPSPAGMIGNRMCDGAAHLGKHAVSGDAGPLKRSSASPDVTDPCSTRSVDGRATGRDSPEPSLGRYWAAVIQSSKHEGLFMERRRFGNTDLTVSTIGLGCYGMSGAYGPADDAESIAT